jgi:hypothetical protein
LRAARAIVREEIPVKRIRPADEHDGTSGRSIVVSGVCLVFMYPIEMGTS